MNEWIGSLGVQHPSGAFWNGRRPILYPHSVTVFLPCLVSRAFLRVVSRFELSSPIPSVILSFSATLAYPLWSSLDTPPGSETACSDVSNPWSLCSTQWYYFDTSDGSFLSWRSMEVGPSVPRPIDAATSPYVTSFSHHLIPDCFNPTCLPS